jgi:N6-L-threonylcarbamoyladenine synthase
MLNEGFEFSFSGLKSSVGRFLDKNPDVDHADVAASFVSACMEILLTKCRRALEAYPAKCLVVVGGVAASPQLREGATELCDRLGVKLCLPPLKWSTDNAAMIGLAAWDYLNAGVAPPLSATASLKITEF